MKVVYLEACRSKCKFSLENKIIEHMSSVIPQIKIKIVELINNDHQTFKRTWNYQSQRNKLKKYSY